MGASADELRRMRMTNGGLRDELTDRRRRISSARKAAVIQVRIVSIFTAIIFNYITLISLFLAHVSTVSPSTIGPSFNQLINLVLNHHFQRQLNLEKANSVTLDGYQVLHFIVEWLDK